MQITSGTKPLASDGYGLFLPGNAGNTYSLIGIHDVQDSFGTYAYSSTNAFEGQVVVDDTTDGLTNGISLFYTGPGKGSFRVASISPPGYSQTGFFTVAAGTALNSITGKRFSCTILDGHSPFAGAGTFILDTAFSGNNFVTAGGPGVYGSTGTYSYSITNRSTAALQVHDSLTGDSTTYMSFIDATSGVFAIAQPGTGGFEIGTFAVSNRWPAFFADATFLGDSWFSLAGTNGAFGFYYMGSYPFIYHLDLGWEYCMDGGNAANGVYFYDFTDEAFFYTQPGVFPTLYDFKRGAWLWYEPLAGTADRYTSNPRWFYDFKAQVWVNHL